MNDEMTKTAKENTRPAKNKKPMPFTTKTSRPWRPSECARGAVR
jgi:hypothetical protein